MSPDKLKSPRVPTSLVIAALASLGAGAIHAAAAGSHSEERQAVLAFTIVAVLQLAWGMLALLRSGRLVAFACIAINGACAVGWIVAKASGISFIKGLDTAEGAGFADTTAFVLAIIAVIGALTAITFWSEISEWFGGFAFGAAALVTAIVTTFAMVGASNHTHAHTHSDSGLAAHTHTDANGQVQTYVVPPHPYDPNKPIDLSGVPGVTPKQQAQAENIIADTLLRLPKFKDYHTAEQLGFKSIGDGITGVEHFVNVGYFDDGHILDADYPESLVYEPHQDGTKKLVAAMYMLRPRDNLADVPNLGGKLMQWHIHNNLCFTANGQVVGVTNADGSCPPGFNKGSQAPMIHVWIVPHPCGPFAALEGVGGGQIQAGQSRLCDHTHGDPNATQR
jgi:hypothetical protein